MLGANQENGVKSVVSGVGGDDHDPRPHTGEPLALPLCDIPSPGSEALSRAVGVVNTESLLFDYWVSCVRRSHPERQSHSSLHCSIISRA